MKRAKNQTSGRRRTFLSGSHECRDSRRRLLVERLEQRQLLAAIADTVPKEWLQPVLKTTFFASDAARTDLLSRFGMSNGSPQSPTGGGGSPSGSGGGQNGSGNAFSVNEREPNNRVGDGQLVPLGNGPGKYPSINLSGTFTFGANGTINDIDYYRFELKGGDIFNVQSSGGASDLSLMRVNANGSLGTEIAGNDEPLGQSFPPQSPLLYEGTSSLAVVIPADGIYALRVGVSAAAANLGTSYTLQLRTHRPVIESQEIGKHQIVFLDFDGAVADLSELLYGALGAGTVRIPPLSESLGPLGLQNRDLNRLIDGIVAEVEENFADIAERGPNGSYQLTGVPGQYMISILNSRDHEDPWGLPNASRVLVGGSDVIFGGGALGVAASIDIGNFGLEETAFVFPTDFAGTEGAIEGIGPGASLIDFYGKTIGLVIAHEMGHYFGGWHTINTNTTANIMDTGGDIAALVGVGVDEIFGTADDTDTDFVTDISDEAASPVKYGAQQIVPAFAYSLGSGTVGGSIVGTVYNDANRNRVQNTGEAGVAGVTVFVDLDGDGRLDAGEISTVTTTTGAYSLGAAPGAGKVSILLPSGAEATTPTTQSVTVPNRGNVTANFGIRVVNQAFTGRKWADLDGDAGIDAGEGGIPNAYIYLDLDGDARLDLAEPKVLTDANGFYTMTFPGPGTYVIREVVEPGFESTFPPEGFYVVTYDGSTPITGKDFGNRPVRDFGDAPASYGTAGAGAASHGILAGLRLGQLIDDEPDGLPTAAANGDDIDGFADDEDGVIQTGPLAPGAAVNFQVTVTNTTGTAYLNAWIDSNQNGVFDSPAEQMVKDLTIVPRADGSATVLAINNFVLPANTQLGDTYVRFRLSPTAGIGATGYVAGGEVEDYLVRINPTTNIANDDVAQVPRGAVAYEIDVLANDLQSPSDPLSIDSVNDAGTKGIVVISSDRKRIFYTPANNFVGLDSFTYTVRSQSGQLTGTAKVNVNVVFQSEVPIAVDDSFNVPQNTSNQPLNVLANDIVSTAGSLRIIRTTTSSAGVVPTITAGGRSILYTPRTGFTGTDQFTYTIQDGAGKTSSAVVTVHMQPGSVNDDRAAFLIRTLDASGTVPISTIPVGQTFKLQVLVDDIRALTAFQNEGLASAYLDLLYTDGLISTLPGISGSGFDYQIEFGPLFSSVKTGNASTPGIFNEIGATQGGLGTSFRDAQVLFTITMEAQNPGTVEFIADPADGLASDTVFLFEYDSAGNALPIRELQPTEIFFGRHQLTIIPSGAPFVYAVDDSYPDQRDSNGTSIVAGQNAVLRVLENDLRGSSGVVEIVNVSGAGNGTVTTNDNNTPNNTNDDYLVYRANAGFVGVDQFTYTIASPDGGRSTAKVTVTVGNAAADDLVAFDLVLKDSTGKILTSTDRILVGQEFSVEIYVDDLRTSSPIFGQEARGVFAAYMDLLYNSIVAEPTDKLGTSFGFDVVFNESKFDPSRAVGESFVPGLINEFGTIQQTSTGTGVPLGPAPVLMATINMIAKAPGTLRVIADPADVSPFQDTLLFEPANVVPIGRITYDVAEVQVVRATGGGEGEAPYQNGRNRWDVNNDGAISPMDALLVLNRLNRGGVAEGEAGGSAGGNTPSVFWDVNGDRKLTPIDALQVINHLNRGFRAPGGGEGEAELGWVHDNRSSGFAAAADSLFSEIGQGEGEGYAGNDPTTTARRDSGAPLAEGSASSPSDEDEDGEEQLGDSITGNVS